MDSRDEAKAGAAMPASVESHEGDSAFSVIYLPKGEERHPMDREVSSCGVGHRHRRRLYYGRGH